ncbi:MAG: hypothetical protein HQL27_03145 [Candidatus Omnitrophica bacterium]|nr:hypothetical protein [Candidatus Omnitrophota bacterium]
MKRIGIAAGKIAKGNLVLYNTYVIAISSVFSFFVFLIAGSIVIFALFIISYLSNEISPGLFNKNWDPVLIFCMISLTIVTLLFNLWAIYRNLKVKTKKNIL